MAIKGIHFTSKSSLAIPALCHLLLTFITSKGPRKQFKIIMVVKMTIIIMMAMTI